MHLLLLGEPDNEILNRYISSKNTLLNEWIHSSFLNHECVLKILSYLFTRMCIRFIHKFLVTYIAITVFHTYAQYSDS